MAEFRVVIDGKLEPKQERAIHQAIQAAVLQHLAGLDVDGPMEPETPRVFLPHGPIPHRPWWGLVAAPVPEDLAETLSARLR